MLMANQTTEEMEELAVEYMLNQKLRPAEAMKKAGLNYEPKTTGYNRVFGKKRRRLRELKTRKLYTENKKLRAHQNNEIKKAESVQQYRHERNRAAMQLETAYAEIRALKKHNTELQKEAETCKQRWRCKG